MSNPVLLETAAQTAVITLNRPERRNAINQALLAALYNIFDEVQSDDAIRAVVITGAGRSFCSGLDLKALETDNLFDPRGDGTDFPDVIGGCLKPVIGAINGHAVTGGLEIALHCDFLIASDRAFFADTHARVGIHPGWGMTQLLQEAVGMRRAKQMSFTGRFVDADTALAWGLVNEVVAHEQLIPRARQIAEEIAESDPQQLTRIGRLIESRRCNSVEKATALERRGFESFAREKGLLPSAAFVNKPDRGS